MNKKEARELSSAGFFSFRTPSKSFFPERWARSGRLLAPLFPVLSEPFWNDHSPQQLLDSRTSLRSLLRNSTISLSLESLHELLVIPPQSFPPQSRFNGPLEDSCKSLSLSTMLD